MKIMVRSYSKIICFGIIMLLWGIFATTAAAQETIHDMSNGSLIIGKNDGDYIIIGKTDGNKVVVEGGEHNIILRNSHISVIKKENKTCAFSIKKGAKVNLTLEGLSNLTSGKDMAGLNVQEGATLIITKESTGRLMAYGNFGGAGIGGNYKETSGDITINGGEIQASTIKYTYLNSRGGAGVGGGYGGSGGNITINGGSLMAFGDKDASGIGGGSKGNGGNTIINGGTVFAEGGENGAGIGGGNKGDGGNITVNGGSINAKGGKNAAAMGGGNNGSGGTTIINDSKLLYLRAKDNGAGIGGGNKGNGGNITMLGGNVDAEGGKDASGIGGGNKGHGGNILIDIGKNHLDAIGSCGASAIGGGNKGNSGNINIKSGLITATRGTEEAQYVGAGKNGKQQDVVISDDAKVFYQSNCITVYTAGSIFTDEDTIIGVIVFISVVAAIFGLFMILKKRHNDKKQSKQDNM